MGAERAEPRASRLPGEARFHLGVLVLSLVVLGVAVVADPSVERVSVLGWDVPTLCLFRAATGIGCPGCGLTRSFAFLAEGRLLASVSLNPLGPALFALVLGQVPYRALRLLRVIRATGAPA